MKEYWVNVYWPEEMIYGLPAISQAQSMINAVGNEITAKYRLHVREFKTREAKELYLKMKYGKYSYGATFEQLQKFPYLKAFIPHIIRN